RLIKTAEKDGAKVTFASNGKTVKPSQETLKNISAVMLTARRYIDYGTIEGWLEVASIRGGKHFIVCEVFTNNRIRCNTSQEQFLQWLPLMKKRLAVSGRIKYKSHKPESINVEEISVLADTSELPQLADIPPIDITGGLSSEEYVRRMRDAQ